MRILIAGNEEFRVIGRAESLFISFLLVDARESRDVSHFTEREQISFRPTLCICVAKLYYIYIEMICRRLRGGVYICARESRSLFYRQIAVDLSLVRASFIEEDKHFVAF